jgi:hypothetical protein
MSYWINADSKEGFIHHQNSVFFPIEAGGIVREDDPGKLYGVLADYGFVRVSDVYPVAIVPQVSDTLRLPAPSDSVTSPDETVPTCSS